MLIQLVTEFPPEDADHNRGHKHPFIASEIFACESSHILDMILSTNSLLSQIFDFLKPASVNPTLSGYFSKLLMTVIEKSPQFVLKELDEQGFIERLTEKISSKSICDAVLKILTLESPTPEFCLGVRSKIFASVLGQLTSSNPLSHYFSAEIVTEFLLRPHETNSWRELLEVVTRSDNLQMIFEASISSEPSRTVAGVRIIKGIINCSVCDYLLRETRSSDDDANVIQEELEEKTSVFVKGIVRSMEGYAVVLSRISEKFIGTNGGEIEILGADRKSIVELILACIRINIKEINREIARTGALTVIFGFFFHFEMNSMLHNLVVQTVIAIFTNLDEDDCLIDCLVQSTLISNLSNPTLNKGYNGHATKIANYLVKIKEKNPKLNDSIKTCPDWENFYTNYLTKTNAIESTPLGETKPIVQIESFDARSRITNILNKISGSNNISRELVSGYNYRPANSGEVMKEPEIEEGFEPDDPGDFFMPSDFDQEIKMDIDDDVEENNRYVDDSPDIRGAAMIIDEKGMEDWNFTKVAALVEMPKDEEVVGLGEAISDVDYWIFGL